MTTVTTTNPVRSDLPETPARDGAGTAPASTSPAAGRGWTAAGVAAALSGIGGSASAIMVDAVYDPDLQGDAPAILAALHDLVGQMVAFHVFSSLAAIGLAVFGLGLFRRLRATSAEHSLAPAAAGFGLLATSVVMVLAGALDTEFVFGAAHPESVVPEAAVVYNHWIGTVPGCWLLVGLSGLGVFAAARSGGVPRWLGRVGLVLGGLTLLVGTLPVQYMAGLTGTVWLLVTAIGFAVGDRAHRAAGK